MIEVIVPKFKELFVEDIWPMMKDVLEFNKFLSDFKVKKKCDRKYMFQILATMRHDELSSIIRKTKKNKFLLENNDENETILIHKSLLEEINSVMIKKRKMMDYDSNIVPRVMQYIYSNVQRS